MYAPQEACGVVFAVKAIVLCCGFCDLGFALWLLPFAIRLQLSELVTDAFLIGRRIPFFFSWSAVLHDPAFPLGKFTVGVIVL